MIVLLFQIIKMCCWKSFHNTSKGVSVSVGVWVVTAPAHNTEHPGSVVTGSSWGRAVVSLCTFYSPTPRPQQRKQVRRDPDGEASSNYSGGCILHILLSCPCTPRTICTLQMLSYVTVFDNKYIDNHFVYTSTVHLLLYMTYWLICHNHNCMLSQLL